MKEIQFNIQKEYREKQEKYVYYLIALSVSAIGFSIYKTENQSLTYSQIPLGIAVLSWSISIFCGLKFIKYIISNLYVNNSYIDIIYGKHPIIRNNPEHIDTGVKGVKKAMEINNNSMSNYFKIQGILFYKGILFFIIWHIIEMHLRA